MKDENFVNSIILFEAYNETFPALCVGKKDKLYCFQVVTSRKKTRHTIPLQIENENRWKYYAIYSCFFTISTKQVIRIIAPCDLMQVQAVVRKYRQLPTVESLKKQYLEEKEKHKQETNREEKKQIANTICRLSDEINSRYPLFLLEARDKANGVHGKYSNFRHAPNNKGTSKFYQGGGCSSK